MRLDLVVLGILAILGQLSIFVVVINVVHAFGWNEHRLDRIKVLILAALVASSGAIGYGVSLGSWTNWPWPFQFHVLACLALALVVVPAVTIVRSLRRDPRGIAEQPTDEVDLAALEGTEALIGEGRYARLLRLPGNASLRLRRRVWDVAIPNLPEAWDGLSVVQITDLHFAPCFRRRFFELVADEAAAWDADLVLFTGDLVDHDESIDWIVPVLSRLKGRLGTFSILGNHDYVHHPRRVTDQLEEAGFTDLEARWTRLEIEGKTLALGGTSFPWGHRLDLDAESDADLRLLLSHSPDQFYRAAAAGIDLMLSGHNHGGQVRVPAIGPILMPSVYSRRFDRGFFRSGATLMHVSQGVAGKHPLRFGCVPEIARFVLHPGRPLAPHSREGSRRRLLQGLESELIPQDC